MAFPWLFPGGIGDFTDVSDDTLTAKKWAERMVTYEDGRFAKDKLWCFYALNYTYRRNNQKSGSFFVDSFFDNGPKTIDELKAAIERDDMSWINRITYYSKQIRGSTGFWRGKRSEVYSWINHHIQEKHGAPDFFITLSCAEYHWPDIKRLVKQRLKIAGYSDDYIEKTSYVHVVNDFTLVVQELFQARVKIWLETVGKKVFGINHYWLRYEFAPSRGQIHAHMLVISKFKDVFHQLYQMRDNQEEQATFIQKWLEKQFKMTCNVPQDHEQQFVKDNTKHPAKTYFTENEDKDKDGYDCLLYMQQHTCSSYCLRKRKRTAKGESKDSKRRRICREGAGIEKHPDMADTPGFPKCNHPSIVKDIRGYLKPLLQRKNIRTVQTSLLLSQGWRANCDFQVLLYDTSPENPDPSEIAQVTDYVVAYTCKGNESLKQEKQKIRDLILSSKGDNVDTNLVKRLARKILNKNLSEKTISKQEAMVHLAGLHLCICSEFIETVSIAGSYRLDSGACDKTLSR
jgi:hypothetical protein